MGLCAVEEVLCAHCLQRSKPSEDWQTEDEPILIKCEHCKKKFYADFCFIREFRSWKSSPLE